VNTPRTDGNGAASNQLTSGQLNPGTELTALPVPPVDINNLG